MLSIQKGAKEPFINKVFSLGALRSLRSLRLKMLIMGVGRFNRRERKERREKTLTEAGYSTRAAMERATVEACPEPVEGSGWYYAPSRLGGAAASRPCVDGEAAVPPHVRNLEKISRLQSLFSLRARWGAAVPPSSVTSA